MPLSAVEKSPRVIPKSGGTYAPALPRPVPAAARHTLPAKVYPRATPRSGLFASSRTRYVIDVQLHPTPENASVAEALHFAETAPNRMALDLFPAPIPPDIDELAEAWDLHPLIVEDIQHAGQRPKLERYGSPCCERSMTSGTWRWARPPKWPECSNGWVAIQTTVGRKSTNHRQSSSIRLS